MARMNDIQKKSILWAAGAMALTESLKAGGKGVGKNTRVVGTSDILPQDIPRNAPCPCGSGRKHKRCCEGR
jgi:uncharacterized protein YecA (UPF0149 family)